MRLLVTGGTGFIGTPLCRTLVRHGHELLILTRSRSPEVTLPGTRSVAWDAREWEQAISGVQGVINLAGEPLAAKRWSRGQKRRITESRVQTTRRLVDAIAASSTKPSVLVSASAVGYYGNRADEPLTESSAAGSGFLAKTCQAWEAEAQRAEHVGVRVVRLRIGVVLGPGGGALAKMAPPFQLFLGGPLGSGRQWMSWVHRDDVIGLIEWALTHPQLSGAVNATAPHPVTMRELCTCLGRVLHRPSWAPVPAMILRLGLGEMAELLLTGQRVIPDTALRAGYVFRFDDVERALEACVHPASGGTADPAPLRPDLGALNHELRTTIVAMRHALSLLADQIAGPLTEEQQSFTAIIQRNLDRLEALLKDFSA